MIGPHSSFSSQMWSRDASLREIQLIRMASSMSSHRHGLSNAPPDHSYKTAPHLSSNFGGYSAAAIRFQDEGCTPTLSRQEQQQRVLLNMLSRATTSNPAPVSHPRAHHRGEELSNAALTSQAVARYIQMQTAQRMEKHQLFGERLLSSATTNGGLQGAHIALELHSFQSAMQGLRYNTDSLLLRNIGLYSSNAASSSVAGHHHPQQQEQLQHNREKRLLDTNERQVPSPSRQLEMPNVQLPCIMSSPMDCRLISSYQVWLRQQIQVFSATHDDVSTHTRCRNKPVVLSQVGIRCRHCAHLPIIHRQKGSTYFPSTTTGLYQAAQNMSSTHMQSGVCTEMPQSAKDQCSTLLATKNSSSGSGRPYWAESAKDMGLIDTEDGIYFVLAMPANARVLDAATLAKKYQRNTEAKNRMKQEAQSGMTGRSF